MLLFSSCQVDSLVEEFAGINRGMEKTGTFTMEKKKLLQLVGKANSNLADVILKVGLFERYCHFKIQILEKSASFRALICTNLLRLY